MLDQPPAPLQRFAKEKRAARDNPGLQQWQDYSLSLQRRRSQAFTGFINVNRGVTGNDIANIRAAPITDETIEPPGALPIHIKGRLSGWGEPANLSTHADVRKIQSAFRSAERGETTQLYQYFRDYLLMNGHLQSEFAKRKMAVVGQPITLKAYVGPGAKKADAKAAKAQEVIEAMIEGCHNWDKGLIDMMDACLYPLAAMEKIVSPNLPGEPFFDDTRPWLRFGLRMLSPVSPFLHSFKLPYLAAGGFQLPMNVPNVVAPNPLPIAMNEPQDTIWNPDTWEPNLRFFRTFPNGYIDYSWANMYAPDPMRHLIHRGNILNGSIWDNDGAVMRATVMWSFFALEARGKFAKAMGKYGQPYIAAEANTSDVNTVNALMEAFSNSAEVGGLLFPIGAKVQLQQAMSTNLAQGWEIFIKFCNSEISKLVIGHEMSTTTKPGGLNEGETKQAGEVREDIRIFDQAMLRQTLCGPRGLFRWFLDINGFVDCPTPLISWAGVSEDDAVKILTQVQLAKQGGLQLAPGGIERVNEITGLEYEMAPEPTAAGMGGGVGGKTDKAKNAVKT